MRKHIDRVLLVGVTVVTVVFLAFGAPLALPASVEYHASETEQTVSE